MSGLDPTLPAEHSDLPALPSYGRFVARGVLGRGGMGVVLRAYDPELDRDVAIKLIGVAGGGTEAEELGAARLQREAQAMAKLAHPNVVAVYEMGKAGDQRFIAMELVEGTTLGKWLHEAPRTRRDIVAAFVACGRGLAAAHAAGLVHRDFKPDNVLVGRDGRPRVSDFGLVSADTVGQGAIAGTPAYMAPEQWLGDEVDARTDQFAFCVALWEALCGARPFRGASNSELRERVLEGAVSVPPPDRAPGRAIEPILRRGLARDRDARWPSMSELLAALDRPERKLWPWIGAAILVAGAGVAMWAMQPGARETCPSPTGRLAGVWDAAIRTRVDTAFRTDGVPRTEGARVEAALDDYATRWAAGVVDTCRAGEARTQPTDLVDKRTLCFERGRAALGALAGVLAGADRATLARAEDAVAALPDLAACDDVDRLAATLPLPTDPALRARIDTVEREVAALEALDVSGEYRGAAEKAQQTTTEARAIGYAPTLSRALLALGDTEFRRSDLAASETAYREAASVAADGHDDQAAAQAWGNVLFVASERREALDAAAALDPVVDAAVRRAGDPPHLRMLYLISSGTLAADRGDLDTSYARYAAAVALEGVDPRDHARALRDLAITTWQRDGAAKAIAVAAQAAEATEKAVGADHPEMAAALMIQAKVANADDDAPRALPLAERSLAIEVSALGPETSQVASTYVDLGNIYSNLGDFTKARAYLDQAIALDEKLKLPDTDLAMTLAAVGALPIGADALPYLERARDLLGGSTETYNAVLVSFNLLNVLTELDRCDEARPVATEIGPAVEKIPALYPLFVLLRAACEKDRKAAVAMLERAHRLCAEQDCDRYNLWEIEMAWGQALYDAGIDRKRGVQLVQGAHDQALAEFPKWPLASTSAAWLDAHGIH